MRPPTEAASSLVCGRRECDGAAQCVPSGPLRLSGDRRQAIFLRRRLERSFSTVRPSSSSRALTTLRAISSTGPCAKMASGFSRSKARIVIATPNIFSRAKYCARLHLTEVVLDLLHPFERREIEVGAGPVAPHVLKVLFCPIDLHLRPRDTPLGAPPQDILILKFRLGGVGPSGVAGFLNSITSVMASRSWFVLLKCTSQAASR
jgi:hypothetical protein